MNEKDFFEELKQIKMNTESSIFDQIKREWGFSTVTLKNWLNKYHPIDLDKDYFKKFNLNPDLFLPPKHNSLWSGSIAISRLKLAIETKAYIIFNNDSELNDNMLTYGIECLRLWLRIDSIKTQLPLADFTKIVNNAFKQATEEPDKLYNYLIDKQDNFKYKKTIYHYKQEDFDSVQSYMTLNEAYEDWMKYTFPHLLEYYKRDRVRQFTIYCVEHQITGEYKCLKYDKLKAELDNIKIKEPNKLAFRKMLDKNNIQYKQKKH